MSESRWTYYDPAQGTQTLGLYHGQDTGNVVIYHNHMIILVDFMVHQSKSYSFMFNENLVKLNLLKENGKYDYKFERTRIEEKPKESSTTSRVKSFFRPFFG